MAVRRPIVCLVTDRRRLSDPDLDALVRFAGTAARAGVNLIQIRERDLDDRTLLDLTRRIVSAVEGTAAAVVVNDRLDVAMAGGACGVHLRADSISATRARAFAPRGFLIGRSVHGVAEAEAAASTDVDYLVAGTIYATPSKSGNVSLLGTAGLRTICGAISVPVLAIGGITTDKVEDIAAAGAAGVAAIGLFTEVIARTSHGDLDAALRLVVARVRRVFDPPAASA